MSDDLAIVSKRFRSAFALDEPKLSRIVGIIQNRFDEGGVPFEPKFAVELANRRSFDLTSLTAVTALDNAVRNPIVSLSIRVGHDPAVDLVGQPDEGVSIIYDASRWSDVSLRVIGPTSRWSQQIFAELEEQVERTLLDNWVYRYLKRGRSLDDPFAAILAFLFWVALAVLSLVSVLMYLIISPRAVRVGGISIPLGEAEALLERGKRSETLDDKVDFLFDLWFGQLNTAVSDASQLFNPWQTFVTYISGVFSWDVLFVFLPVLVVVGCLIYSVKYCYPRGVFAWGDYQEHYARLVSVRKTLWSVVIVSILLGVMTNLFVVGLSRFM